MKTLVILLSLIPSALLSQSILLEVLSENIPVSYASITISNNKYTITNEKGVSHIDPPLSYPLIIKVSCIGYKNKIDTIFKYVNRYTIKLKQHTHNINETEVRGYTDIYLTRYVCDILKKVSINNSLYETYHTETYTLENQIKIIERLKSTLIFTYENKKLYDIKFKAGVISINRNSLNEQFRCEALTSLLLITNPQYLGKSPERLYSLFSLVEIDPQQILKYFKVSYSQINYDLMISLKHVGGKYEIVLDVDKEINKVNEVRQQWLLTDKYPITTSYPSAKIQDTLKIIQTNHYKDMKNHAFSFFSGINYMVNQDVYKISTYSYGIIDTLKKINYPPVTYHSSISDYTNLLAIPKVINDSLYGTKNIYNTYLDSILETQYELVSSLDITREGESNYSEIQKILEKISMISHWNYEWTLEWDLLPYHNKIIHTNSNSIKIYIWADYYTNNNKIEFIVEPIFDYNYSYYQDVRNEGSKTLIELLMHHSKYLTLKLKNDLNTKFDSNITYDQFKQLVFAYQKQLNKDIFRYKAMTNFGKDNESLINIRKEIFDNLFSLL